jgi:hypothetical protein
VTAVAEVPVADVSREGPRLFATPKDEPRARRASDVIVLVAAAVILALISFAAVPSPGFVSAIAAFLDALPGFLGTGWQFAVDLLVLVTIVLVVAMVVRKRWSITRDIVVAVLVATGVWLLVGRIVEGSWPAIWDALRASAPPPWYPSPRVAIFGAAVLTVSPHLTRPVRLRRRSDRRHRRGDHPPRLWFERGASRSRPRPVGARPARGCDDLARACRSSAGRPLRGQCHG